VAWPTRRPTQVAAGTTSARGGVGHPSGRRVSDSRSLGTRILSYSLGGGSVAPDRRTPRGGRGWSRMTRVSQVSSVKPPKHLTVCPGRLTGSGYAESVDDVVSPANCRSRSSRTTSFERLAYLWLERLEGLVHRTRTHDMIGSLSSPTVPGPQSVHGRPPPGPRRPRSGQSGKMLPLERRSRIRMTFVRVIPLAAGSVKSGAQMLGSAARRPGQRRGNVGGGAVLTPPGCGGASGHGTCTDVTAAVRTSALPSPDTSASSDSLWASACRG
jgi:hypothetical protein